MDNYNGDEIVPSVPLWLRRLGIQGWLFFGVSLAVAVIFSLIGALNQIITSLVVSLLLAILSRPLVDWLERHRISRGLGAILTMVLILLGLIGLIVIMVQGVIQQGSEITTQLQAGWTRLQNWLSSYNIQLPSVEVVMITLQDALPVIFEGVFGFVGSTLSTVIKVIVGLYFSIFILFFLLQDIAQVETWFARWINREPEVGSSIVRDAGGTVRVYFRGVALTALITSIVVAIPLVLLKVPLVGSILLLYFFTSFIPYLGAWIAGTFAVLIALGSGGITTAWIILIAVLISNGAIQSAVNSWALGSMLKLHPLLIFLVTIVAGMVGGILLMILAVPLTATIIQVIKRLRQVRMTLE